MSRRGLPTGLSMRHDAHYVEELTQSNTTTHVGRLIPIDKLDPNPDQPRTEIGDLTELTASISEKGVLEPLLVKPTLGRWMIIAGERRWRAATAAGLTELPCIEMDIDEAGVAEVALIENMQRKDLTPWEEADGLRALCERFGYTHEDVARKVGKSRSTVTEALSIASIPKDIREICRASEITSKSLLLQIVRQPDDESMRSMAEQIGSEGLTRDGARKARRAFVDPTGASEPYVYRYEAPGREFKVEVKFKKANISTEELFDALNAAAQNIDEAS
ncbi:MAG: ParB family transcriptional regulator, chromosome partitioning protein [Blastocatellia bacterium]|nr:ParB family transcriptional regulator, chromosome partitioning protein [Blastocatellia bacterium]